MTTLAVTVIGEDRPGIVAEVSGRIAELGGNLEDSSMTLLRGHFAMTLIATVQGQDLLTQKLTPLADEGLVVSVFEVPSAEAPEISNTQILSLHGSDRPEIVSETAALIAKNGGNITDVSTRLGKDIYVLTAEVQFPIEADLAAVKGDLAQLAKSLGVTVSLRAAEEDVF